jgi:Uma2 family endonuclease
MTADELFQLPDAHGVDRWLFSGELVERPNRNHFHSPGHSSAVVAISSLLGGWARAAGAERFRAYGYGCPYLLGRDPDTLVSFDASLALRPVVSGPDMMYLTGPPVLGVEVMELGEDEVVVRRLVAESLRRGVREVWVINPAEETVTTHTHTGHSCYAVGKLTVTVAHDWPPFRCRAEELFE